MGDAAAEKVTIQHDATNEMIVIAAVLVDESIRNKYVPKEPADRFIDTGNALIWGALQRVLARKQGFDLQLLHREVAGKVSLQHLKDLQATYPSPPVAMDEHISALQWDSTRARATQDTIPDFLRALKDNTVTPAKVQALAERVARSLVVKADKSFMSDAKLLAAQQRLEIEKRRKVACYEYGIQALDYFPSGDHRCIPGAAPGKITNITGVSGSAKSVLAEFFALEQVRRGRYVLYGAWEQGQGDTLEALANISFRKKPLAGLTGSRYASATGALDESDMDSFEARMFKIAQRIRFFDPPFSNDLDYQYTNSDAIDELHRMVVDSGCDVVVYDLFERCMPEPDPGSERRALFKLQHMHQETNTHCIMVTQQKLKEVENSADKRPTRAGVFGTQAWIDISDTVLAVHRPALWKPIPDDTLEILILKQRWGKWPLAIAFDWDGDRMTIENGRDVDYEHAIAANSKIF